MPVYSMTGYASAQHGASATGAENDTRAPQSRRLGLEIRSVNSRFLDLSFRLPAELRAMEPALRSLLTARLKRGKVEVRAALENEDSNTLQDPPARLLQRLNSLQDSVKAWLPTAAPREREGKRLATMLLDRVKQLRALAEQAIPMVPLLVEQQRLRFMERWKEAMALTDGATLPEAARDRALTEATAFAIRIDVAEEITRLDSHLDEIERLLKKGGEVGKRLDMKVLIEQMREQVQNIE